MKPVLIITYSRPESCMAILDTLYEQGCKKVYVAIDFGKTDALIIKQLIFNSLESHRCKISFILFLLPSTEFTLRE